jgi:hypothetical protein
MVLIGCVSSTGQGTAFKEDDDDLVSVQFSALTVPVYGSKSGNSCAVVYAAEIRRLPKCSGQKPLAHGEVEKRGVIFFVTPYPRQ